MNDKSPQDDCQGELIFRSLILIVSVQFENDVDFSSLLLLTALDVEKLLCGAVISPHADPMCPTDLMTTALCQSRLQPVNYS